jgi:hypothetical protein
MSDRVFFPSAALAALVLIALAWVWPQGLGARSPWPFGHALVRSAPAASPVRPPALRAPTAAAIAGLRPHQ